MGKNMTQNDHNDLEFDLFRNDEFANGNGRDEQLDSRPEKRSEDQPGRSEQRPGPQEQQPQDRTDEQLKVGPAPAKEITPAEEEASDHTEAERSVQEEETPATFEEEMQELQLIVDRLETGEVPLEEAIQLFQKGMNISRSCHQKLEKVEKEVHLLLEEEGEVVNKPFELEEDPS
jgi:exodeoxyribonuclease VII small subunit